MLQLLQENEEIGKMISSGRLAKLEGELAMQKNLCEEMKKNQAEMDDFVQVSGIALLKADFHEQQKWIRLAKKKMEKS
jgi:hypothetical protein